MGDGQESIDAQLSLSLSQAWQMREGLDLVNESFRLIHGEADGFPGLIVDWYALGTANHAVANLSIQSAGAELLVPLVKTWLKRQAHEMGFEIAVGEMRDSISRVYEGLKQETEVTLTFSEGFQLKKEDLENAIILVSGLRFECNLVTGQKTGFFLDQRANAATLAHDFATFAKSRKMVRVLDLCSYVGQWSSAWVSALGAATANVTLIDASSDALSFAANNVMANWNGGAREDQVINIKGDILNCLGDFKPKSFDVVILDPPALIKNKKSLGPGVHAYTQANAAAMRLVSSGGILVSSSCSGLLNESAFLEVLAKASKKSGRTVRWVKRAGGAEDHPMLAEFPEGHYLKTYFGVVT